MDNNGVNEVFNKYNVDQIVVPEVVKEDLLSIIEEKLSKVGFYYRVAYRVKTSDSILNKLLLKQYRIEGSPNEHKKMQDLVGIRVILYYEDDVEICKDLLDTIFSTPGVWETTEASEYEFKASKVNGIFKLPAYLSKNISNPMLSDYIDDTFEIQVRTNSFEGWHEIEHDTRYKGSAFGGNEALARKMNSILATYELCDDSMVGLIEDLGHHHYKNKNWNDMLRCHYRLKFENEPLHPYVEEIFNSDKELAKKFYKFKRANLINQLCLNVYGKQAELTVTNIVRIVNQIGPNDDRLNDAFVKIELEKKEGNSFNRRRRFEPFKTLGQYKVFHAKTDIDLNNLSIEDAFRKASNLIYSWVNSRFNEVFTDIPEEVASYSNTSPGYSVMVSYNPEKLEFVEKTTHLDSNVATRLWISDASIKKIDNRLEFEVTNRYAEPEDRFRDTDNILFSRPNFYGEIADNIGICDVEKLKEAVKYVDNNEDYDNLVKLIKNDERRFPVVIFNAEGDWIDEFDINYFAYLVGYYSHIKMFSNKDQARRFANDFGLNMTEYVNSITVCYPRKDPITSYNSDIMDSSYEVIKFDKKKYWNETGCRAFRRQLVADIRENNIIDRD